jgi:UPF0176 protein
MSIVNLAAYRFVPITAPAAWQPRMRTHCESLALRGTVLLAPEGINLFIAGERAATDAFKVFLREDPLFDGAFAGLEFKESLSATQPFKHMRVKLKPEIITLRMAAIDPAEARAPAVDARTLRTWLAQGCDGEGRPVVMLDTRNAFEVGHGTFDGAMDLGLSRFSEFPAALARERAALEGKTVVSFCTGGIRCEKAALYMAGIGVEHVYQLEGGILKYFEEVGDAFFKGTCFVFDERTALDPSLAPAVATANPT